MSQLFASGDQSIGVSASASVLPMNIQDWFPALQETPVWSLGWEVNGNSLQYSCWRIKWTEEPGGHTTEQLHFQSEKLFSKKHNTLGTFDHLIFILDTNWLV